MLTTAPITRERDITAAWLGSVLRQAEGHGNVRVTALEVERYRSKPLSVLYRLVPTYDLRGGLPESFILKCARPDETTAVALRRRTREHAYYTEVAPEMADPPSPRAWSAALDPASGVSHLLMDDLTGSHDRPPRGLPPTPAQAEGAMEAFAALHAGWWNDPRLKEAVSLRDAGWHDSRGDSARTMADELLAEHGPYLAASVREAVALSGRHLTWLLRATEAGAVSAVHGDAHPWNVLTPLDPGGQPALVDWEAWTIDSPALDIASYIALRFDPALRRELEPGLLRRYHGQLLVQGVAGYPWDEFLLDYRRAIARRVTMPVTRWKRGDPVDSWWNTLSRICLAWQDHDCAGVLPD